MSSLRTSRTLYPLPTSLLLLCMVHIVRNLLRISNASATFSWRQQQRREACSFAAAPAAAAADVAEIRKNCSDCREFDAQREEEKEREKETGRAVKSLVFIFCCCQLSPLCMLHLVWPACVCVRQSVSQPQFQLQFSICISISASLSVFCAALCHC